MTGPIQKIFTTRAEQYPEPTAADVAQGTARAVLAAIPVLGGSITEALSIVLSPAVARRRDQWFKDLADLVEELVSRVDGLRPEALAENEVFVSAVIQATRIAIGTHRQEKRGYLRNALFRIALDRAPEDELQQIFLRYVDEFTPMHLQVLKILADNDFLEHEKRGLTQGGSFPVGRYIDEAVSSAFRRYSVLILPQIINDLHVRDLCTVSSMKEQFQGSSMVTEYGRSFLAFVSPTEK